MTQSFNMNQYNTLAEAIAANLEPYDKKTIEANVEYAAQAQARMQEFRDSEEGDEMSRKNTYRFAQILVNLAGGKGWSTIIRETGLGSQRRYDAIAKKCNNTFKARNSRIATKLTKAGVKEVKDAKVNYTHGGFTGSFTVDTDQGDKVVTLEVILAGGYNIQCLHNRVLVKVK